MQSHEITQSATYQLATRFLGVFTSLFELTKPENPDNVVGQLNVKQLLALDLIRREPGISQKALAERLEVTPASVSIWIAKMLESKLVERSAHPDDARVMHLYLGSYGQELVNEVEQKQINTIVELLGDLPLEDQQLVVETLERALALRAQRQESQYVESV